MSVFCGESTCCSRPVHCHRHRRLQGCCDALNAAVVVTWRSDADGERGRGSIGVGFGIGSGGLRVGVLWRVHSLLSTRPLPPAPTAAKTMLQSNPSAATIGGGRMKVLRRWSDAVPWRCRLRVHLLLSTSRRSSEVSGSASVLVSVMSSLATDLFTATGTDGCDGCESLWWRRCWWQSDEDGCESRRCESGLW